MRSVNVSEIEALMNVQDNHPDPCLVPLKICHCYYKHIHIYSCILQLPITRHCSNRNKTLDFYRFSEKLVESETSSSLLLQVLFILNLIWKVMAGSSSSVSDAECMLAFLKFILK